MIFIVFFDNLNKYYDIKLIMIYKILLGDMGIGKGEIKRFCIKRFKIKYKRIIYSIYSFYFYKLFYSYGWDF